MDGDGDEAQTNTNAVAVAHRVEAPMRTALGIEEEDETALHEQLKQLGDADLVEDDDDAAIAAAAASDMAVLVTPTSTAVAGAQHYEHQHQQQQQQQPQQHQQQQQQQQHQQQQLASSEALSRAVQRFRTLYEDAHLIRALEHLDEFAAAHPSVTQPSLDAALASAGLDAAALRARAALVRRGLAEIADDSGWRVVSDGDPAAGGLRLLHRRGRGRGAAGEGEGEDADPSLHHHGFKATTELDCELPQLLSMARETDLVPSWNSYIPQADVLKVDALVEVLVYASVWFPWPLAHRDVVVQAVGVDLLEEDGSVALALSSPPGAPGTLPPGVEPPPGFDERSHVRVIDGSCMKMTPLPPRSPGGRPRVRVSLAVTLDAGGWVPDAVVDVVLHVLAPFFLSAVQSTVQANFKDESGPLPTRMRARPELYEMLAERSRRFLEKQEQKQSSSAASK